MGKRIVSLVLIIIIVTIPVIYATTAYKWLSCQLSINGVQQDLQLHPVVIDGVAMLPMREFFEMLNTKVTWHEKTREITAYKKNMYVRLQVGSHVAYKNGKSYQLSYAPTILDGHTYLPAKFTSESFDMTYQFTNNTIVLTDRDVTQTFVKSGLEYTTKTIKDYNLTIALPYGWQELSKNQFGIKDPYDDYNILIKRYDNVEGYSLADYKQRYKDALVSKYGPALTFTYNNQLQTDALLFESFGYNYKGASAQREYMVSITEKGARFYIVEGSYQLDSNETYVKEIFNTILRSARIDNATVNSESEHYVEYEQAFNIGLKLDTEITSNQEVDKFLNITGSIDDTKGYNALYTIVTRGQESKVFNIPLDESGHFSSKVYTPFGLGKHNLEIYANNRGAGSDALLLKFSVINLSAEVTKYLIPTTFVQTNTTEVASLADYLTYQSTSTYLKAKSIHDYLISDITLENMTLESLQNMRSSTQVVLQKKATPLEVAITMTALLRTSDISAKVVVGKSEGIEYYAVEAKINGNWVIYDPVSELQIRANPELIIVAEGEDAKMTPQNYSSIHFHLNLERFKALFNNYDVLNY